MSFSRGNMGTICALHCVHQLMWVRIILYASPTCIRQRTLSSLHHDVCKIGSASWQLHCVISTISIVYKIFRYCIAPALQSYILRMRHSHGHRAYASHTCVKHEHRHSCIMVYASLDQHHNYCIASYAPFQLRREHSIIALHHHCNPTSYGCIIIMVSSICTWSWKILSLPLDGLGIHKHILPLASCNSIR